MTDLQKALAAAALIAAGLGTGAYFASRDSCTPPEHSSMEEVGDHCTIVPLGGAPEGG